MIVIADGIDDELAAAPECCQPLRLVVGLGRVCQRQCECERQRAQRQCARGHSLPPSWTTRTMPRLLSARRPRTRHRLLRVGRRARLRGLPPRTHGKRESATTDQPFADFILVCTIKIVSTVVVL